MTLVLLMDALAWACAFFGLGLVVVSYLATRSVARLDPPQFAARMLFPVLFFTAALTLHVVSR